jgi:hypothetical protein
VEWVKALRDNLRPLAHGVYVNQLGETSEELVRSAVSRWVTILFEDARKKHTRAKSRIVARKLPQVA